MNRQSNIALLLLWLLVLCMALPSRACTSAIVSGKYTADGRPLMWKNRDTSNPNNCVVSAQGERYRYVAVVNSKDAKRFRSVWIGTNEKGFAIMNTLSYNLMGEKSGVNNGSLMKRALEICADVDDFKHFLDTLSRPMLVCSNYGVIDAKGGASYFEVGDSTAVQYDVNDPTVAPCGFLVRANFSFTGRENEGKGYVRYQCAEERLVNTDLKKITPAWLFNNLSRSFYNPLMGVDLTDGRFNSPYTNGWFCEEDFIVRRKTTCAVVIKGVKEGETPDLTTMWTVIGYPPVTPAVPVWVKCSEQMLPSMVAYDESCHDAPLCNYANKQLKEIYSYTVGDNAEDYFCWDKLFSPEGNGLMQQTINFEQSLFDYYQPIVDKMYRKGKLDAKAVGELYSEADKRINNWMKETR